ncbi:recombinase family protein [Rhodopila sp.]|uniref:recombinase family protein n=1 Tax=Rhodopila sp. TaxID=2480087 RepID=UPI003D0DD8E9
MASDLVKPNHLDRRAVIYVRQSTQHQVLTNQESTRLQYALRQRARDLGWREADIEVIDSDLGLSGSNAAGRQGFKDLVARVTLGEVGLILSIEVTRLARNCSDWYPLLDVCGHRHCLIGDRDGIYDPALPDGRLLLGLKGMISEVELHTIRGRLTAGLVNKAQRGDLALQLPAGLLRDPSGVVTKDPNQEVQERVALVFDSFLKLRSAVRVTRALYERGLGLPRNTRHGEVYWKAPTIPAVTCMLQNPAYAGAFVYGRTCMREVTPGGSRKQARRPDEGWRFVVRDRYPAYVGWDTFEKVQAMLRDNRAEYVHLKTRGIPRDGAALLHGITWCGECGHKMTVRYKGGSQYVCNHLQVQHGHVMEECQVLRSAAIDACVASAFLDAVTPAEMDAWSEARRVECQADTALRRAEEQQVERLRYQASLAERQFNRVDPDNRLVAAELERRWEAALVELRRAQAALAQYMAPTRAGAPATLEPQLRVQALAVGQGLSALWADPGVSREHRKALLRCLIDKVVLRRTARDAAAVRVVWRGGEVSEMQVALPVNELAALPRGSEMEARVLELARAGVRDPEIVQILTAEGHRSTRLNLRILPSTVQAIRLRHGVKAAWRCTRWPPVPGWLTVAQAAARLPVPEKWLRKKLRAGVIRGRLEPSGRYLIPDRLDTLEAIRLLRAGIDLQADLLPGVHQQEGHHYA